MFCLVEALTHDIFYDLPWKSISLLTEFCGDQMVFLEIEIHTYGKSVSSLEFRSYSSENVQIVLIYV